MKPEMDGSQEEGIRGTPNRHGLSSFSGYTYLNIDSLQKK
jgi:hypothetical protein